MASMIPPNDWEVARLNALSQALQAGSQCRRAADDLAAALNSLLQLIDREAVHLAAHPGAQAARQVLRSTANLPRFPL